MKIEELLCIGNKSLHKDQTKLILGTILNLNPLELNLYLNKEIDNTLVKKYLECLENVKNGIPIQYALKSVSFFGYDFYVDSRVLIPRFETEELVNYTNIYIKKYFKDKIKVLDLGCGSGCIGLTLKKLNNNLDIYLSDISQDALDVTEINKNNLNLDVNLIKSDLFSNINQKFDVLVSNPPYISYMDKVDELVLKNEPHLALYAENNGLYYYEKIFEYCEKYLNKKYLIALEIGSNQKESILDLINKYFNNVKVITKKDIYNRDRMIFIFKNIIINE